MKRFSLLLVVVLSLLVGMASASPFPVYNPQADFSNSNPSGVWSYGVVDPTNANPATNLTLFSTYTANSGAVGNPPSPTGVNAWGQFPGIFDNTNSTTTTVYTTIAIPGQTLVLHPPNDSTETDLRFTAPVDFKGVISAAFSASDTHTTTSTVEVLVNGTQVFSSAINASAGGGLTSFVSGPLNLTAGETVDFRVGDGTGGYSNDGTRLVASITTVPEPSSIALLCAGGVSLLVVGGRRLRRRA